MSAPDAIADLATDPQGVRTTVAPSASSARRAKRYLFIAMGFAVYLCAVWFIGWQKIRDALAGADPRFVALAAMLTGAGAVTRMWKWRRALGAQRHSLGLYFLSRSGGVWSPARVGEFLPLLWKRHRNARVAAWILFDRVLEVIVTLAFGLVGLAFVRLLPLGAFAAVAAATVLAAAFGVYALTRRELLDRIAARAPAESRLRAVLIGLSGTSGEIRAYLHRPLGLAGLTVAAKVFDVYSVVLIFHALHVDVRFTLIAAAKCALALVSYVPITPMTTGIPHAVQGWMMFESAGVRPETVVASVGIEAGIMFLVFGISAAAAARAIKHATL